MQFKKYFVNKRQLEFLEVGLYDLEELTLLGTHTACNVAVEMDALICLKFFPNITHLRLLPGNISPEYLRYLHGLPIVSLDLNYYSDTRDEFTIDLSQFPKLQYVFSRSQCNFTHVNKCPSLRTLVVQEWQDADLCCLKEGTLSALYIFGGSLCTLEGITELQQLHSLSLFNLPRLTDICCIDKSKTLESFAVERCNKVDITSLTFLPRLRYLQVVSKKSVQNLSFLQQFPVLEYIMLDIPVEDGDLSALFHLKHSVILTDRRNFSVRNKDLPKSKQRFHSAFIPEWLEILPEAP